MPSIRKRLTLLLAAGFVVLLVGTGLALANVVEARVTEEFDVALRAKANALVALTEQEDGHIQLDYEPSAFPEFERDVDPDYFAFWLDDGKLLLTSRHLKGDLPRRTPAARSPCFTDVDLPDGRRGRLVQIDYVPALEGDLGDFDEEVFKPDRVAASLEQRGLTLVVARSRARLDNLIRGIWMTILGVGGLSAVLAGLFVWRALAGGLRPIDRIASQVSELDAEQLEERVVLPRTPRELAPIVGQINALLARLEQSFERERRFAGNVAHELRTPIAELRALAEIGGRWPDDTESVARFFDDVEAIAGRMEGVVADLLLLARCQAGIEIVERAPVGLREALLEAWAKHAGGEAAAKLECVIEVPPELVLDSDAGKLGIIFGNVFGNAVSYSRPGSVVHCAARQSAGGFTLEITNAAEPLTPEELERLAEPFWRKDVARASSDHAGLGLSVVAELAALLGLGVCFEQDAPGTFCVRFEGPARGRARAAHLGVGVS